MSSKYGKLRPLMLVAIISLSMFSTGILAYAIYQATLNVNLVIDVEPTQGLMFFDASNNTISSIDFGHIIRGHSSSLNVWVKNVGTNDQSYYLTNPDIGTDVHFDWDYDEFIINHGEIFQTVITATVNATATSGAITGHALIFSPFG